MTRGPVLLARTPNGDAAFVRREDDQIWLISSHLTEEVAASEVEDAVAVGDFIWDERSFDTWEQLHEAMDAAARAWLDERTWPGVESYSVRTVTKILDHAERMGGDNHELALSLLRDCPAATDRAVHGRLVALLAPAPAKLRLPRDARNRSAYERVHRGLAA